MLVAGKQENSALTNALAVLHCEGVVHTSSALQLLIGVGRAVRAVGDARARARCETARDRFDEKEQQVRTRSSSGPNAALTAAIDRNLRITQ